MSNNDTTLEQLIRQSYQLSTNPSSKGWWTCACPVCRDYKKRAGFQFNVDSVVYHCFNCNHTAGYDPTISTYLNDNMVVLLDALNVDEIEYKALTFNHFISKSNKQSKPKLIIDPDIELHEIKLPEFFIPLDNNSDHPTHISAIEYIHRRGLTIDSYPFMVLDPNYKILTTDVSTEYRKWKNRLIIPYYRSKKLVWFQGRDLSPHSKMRYLNAETPSECIIGNHQSLDQHSLSPIYITEGFFDSIIINGVCIFGNTFKSGQIKLLQRNPREKIYIPDNSKDAQLAACQAISLGWKISVPDIGSCKDLNAAHERYGKLYVMKSLYDNIVTGKYAQLKISTLGLNNTLTSNKLR